jgi:hypothetical protein
MPCINWAWVSARKKAEARPGRKNPGQNQQQFLVGGKQADRLLPGQIAVETHGIAPLSRRSRAQ